MQARSHGRRGGGTRGQAAADARVALALRPHLADSKPLVISVAAGIPHAALARWFGPHIAGGAHHAESAGAERLRRHRPVRATERGRRHRALAESIMAAVSATVWVEHESQMDTVTALSGSGPRLLFPVHGSARGGGARARTAQRHRAQAHPGDGLWRGADGAPIEPNRSPRCASRSPRRAAPPRRRSRCSMPPACALSSRMRWRRPIAARPSSPPNSDALRHPSARRFSFHGSDQIHRRHPALAVDAGVHAASPVSVGAGGLSRSDGGCDRARHQLADHAAAAAAAADRQDRHGHRAGGAAGCRSRTPRRCSRSPACGLPIRCCSRASRSSSSIETGPARSICLRSCCTGSRVSSRPGGYAPGVRLLAQLCEPILRPVRRVIPPIGQIDFSFLWVSIAIGALLILAALNMHVLRCLKTLRTRLGDSAVNARSARRP